MKRDLGTREPRKKKPVANPVPVPPPTITPPEKPEWDEKDTEPRGHAARV